MRRDVAGSMLSVSMFSRLAVAKVTAVATVAVVLSTFSLFLLPSPAHADVHGIAYGFVQSVEADFDGLGSCRMVLFDQRYNVIDFPAGELADACEAAPPGVFHYFEAIVDDADLIPCTPSSCSRVSAMSHYIAGAVTIP